MSRTVNGVSTVKLVQGKSCAISNIAIQLYMKVISKEVSFKYVEHFELLISGHLATKTNRLHFPNLKPVLGPRITKVKVLLLNGTLVANTSCFAGFIPSEVLLRYSY